MMKLTPLLLLTVILCGCNTYVRVPDKNSAPSVAKNSTVCMMVPEAHVTPEVAASHVAQYTGGGLIPALIDVGIEEHRTDVAEKNLVFIQGEADKYTSEVLEQVLRSQLRLAPDVTPQFIVCVGKKTTETRVRRDAKDQPILVLTASYSYSQNVTTLKLVIEATAYTKGTASSPFYHNILIAETNTGIAEAVNSKTGKLTPVEEAAFRKAFETASSEIAKLLLYDISHSPKDDANPFATPHLNYSGPIIHVEGDREWARCKNGSLVSCVHL